MVIQDSNDDPIRTYSDQEKEALTRNLFALTIRVKAIDSHTREYGIDLICEWHAQLFAGVREHAGKYRNKDYGEEYLQFGRYRSAVAREVPQELLKHARNAHNLLDQLQTLSRTANAVQFLEDVIRSGFFLHAQFINIHPFRDGNGRVGRLIITYFLARFGLPTLAIEVPKQEYLEALNSYHDTGDMRPLVDLALRIFKNQLGIR